MNATGTQWLALKNAFVAAAHTLWDSDQAVQIVFGQPGYPVPDDIVAITDGTTEQQPGPMGGRRLRDEDLTQDVVISIWRPGGQEMEKVAAERADELLRQLEHQVRHTDTTLGGVVEWCFLTSVRHEGTPQELTGDGRLCQLTVTFTARARISSTTPVEFS
ncbi:hypothetical protein [Agromyces sp. SYSU T00194]|uniref:hypothetical protein n=1 Tax=Agromyces chitinivorans TaxID=3158560 RepID=UPI003390CEF8